MGSPSRICPAYNLWLREVFRFYRQRVARSRCYRLPVIFWLVIGSALQPHSARRAAGQQHYLDYFYPGALIMIVLLLDLTMNCR